MNRYGPAVGLELYHHGIKGQKWGVRRTASQLGHKTAKRSASKSSGVVAGIKSMKKSVSKKIENAKAKRDKRNAEKQTKKTGELVFSKDMTTDQKKEAVLKSRSAAELYKHADLFDNNELNAAYNRLNTERNIKNLIPAEKSKGESYVKAMQKMGDAFQKTSNAISGASNLYNNIAKVFNAVAGADDQLPIIGEKKERKKPETKSVTFTKQWTDPKTGVKNSVVETSTEKVSDKDRNRADKMDKDASNVGKKVTSSLSNTDYNSLVRKQYDQSKHIQDLVANMSAAQVANDARTLRINADDYARKK